MVEQAATSLCTQSTEALASRMLDATAYLHPVADLQMIETYPSWVSLAGEFAYEVRRSIKLDFVDFSMFLVRQTDCEEECHLNRRLASALYLGVTPISNDPAMGAIRANRRGMPDEHAVCIRRFAQQDVLVTLARDGRFCPKEIDALADPTADLHAAVPAAGTSLDGGTPSGIRHMFEDCAAGVITLGYTPLDAATTVSLLRQRTVRPEETFVSCRHSRHIREYHGDLHLGNIVLIDGQPTPFDCLEFSPSLRWIDAMYNTAFLFMDLLATGLDGLAYRLISRYLERCSGYGRLAALPFYVVIRAFARARISLERAYQLGGILDEVANLHGEVSHMLALSRHLLCRNNACILLMHSLSGNGKLTRTA